MHPLPQPLQLVLTVQTATPIPSPIMGPLAAAPASIYQPNPLPLSSSKVGMPVPRE